MIERVVWKYELEPGADIRIDAGKNSVIRCTEMQFMPVMWVEHETTKGEHQYDRVWEVLLAATGAFVPSDWEYTGTVQAATLVRGLHPETEEPVEFPKFVVWHVYFRVAEADELASQGSVTE